MEDIRNARAARGRPVKIVIFGLLLVGLTAVAQPAEAQVSGAMREACRADYQKFCANLQPGGGRIRQCMMENADRLSPQCKEALKRQNQQ